MKAYLLNSVNIAGLRVKPGHFSYALIASLLLQGCTGGKDAAANNDGLGVSSSSSISATSSVSSVSSQSSASISSASSSSSIVSSASSSSSMSSISSTSSVSSSRSSTSSSSSVASSSSSSSSRSSASSSSSMSSVSSSTSSSMSSSSSSVPPSTTLHSITPADTLRFDKLHYLRLNLHAGGNSSASMLNNNNDFAHYLTGAGFQVFNGEYTLADLTGPGAIYRFWETDNNDNGIYRFYFDGETTASLTIARPDFWSAMTTPFVPPLSRTRADSSGGNITYVPIPYAKSLRITESFAGFDFYNIGYVTYEADSKITSYSAAQDTSGLKSLFVNAGQNPHPSDATEEIFTKVIGIAANTSTEAASLSGAREITEIRFSIPGYGSTITAQQLNTYRLQITWDGETSPAVDVPLAQFFALSPDWNLDVKAIPLGKLNDSLYCYFPMPFAKSATIKLVGTATSTAVSNVSVSIKHRAFTDSIESVGTFHATFRSASDTNQHTFLDATGSGHLVGVAITYPGKGNVLEGNENIYVDGLRFPSIFGTGTEDFFNAGWYFQNNSFSLPLHGASLSSNAGNGPLTAYRFFLGDAIPFSSSLLARIQRSEPGALLSSVAYYYLNPTIWSSETDSIHFSSQTSVTAHQYSMSGSTALHITDKFLLNDATQTFDGFAGHAGSVISFKAAIDPNNDGIALRRVLRAAGDQSADVSIDGISVGTWHTVETVLDADASNPAAAHLYERELWVPASFTHGKSSINVGLTVHSADWNDLEYSIHSRVPNRF